MTLLRFIFVAFALMEFGAQSATFHKIHAAGPSSNRVDVVVLSEGYTSAQNGRFLTDATNAFNGLLAHAPLSSYKEFFNGFAIFVASTQAGSDHLGLSRNTYFNSSFDDLTDFLITIDAQGQSRADALIAQFKPDADLVIVLVNDMQPGGSDGYGKAVIASVSANSRDILAHEVGHVLARLGDEYDVPYPGFPDTEAPNTTRETRREFIKWKAWLAPETPVPTPETFDYEQVVGVFEGAHYHETGWYRPKFDCKMNHYSVPFCEVCSEQLVLSILARARPLAGRSPMAHTIDAGTSPLQFDLQLLRPLPDTLVVQWSLNGTAIPGATSSSLSLSPQSLPAGSNYVAAEVFDSTSFVRNDPSNLRRQGFGWTVNSAQSAPLQISDPRLQNPRELAFKVTGPANSTFVLQSSTNMLNWSNVSTNTLPGDEAALSVPVLQLPGPAFFRALRRADN